MKALMNRNVKTAILFPSLFFGILHLLNLFSGANLLVTVLQCIYASFFAAMCSVFVYKTGNIIPCIVCHSITNITDIFIPDNLPIKCQLLGCFAVIIPSVFYVLYLLRSKKGMGRNWNLQLHLLIRFHALFHVGIYLKPPKMARASLRRHSLFGGFLHIETSRGLFRQNVTQSFPLSSCAARA